MKAVLSIVLLALLATQAYSRSLSQGALHA